MKKVIFSAAAFGLVAVSSIALVPTTAEAIPAFARQTGAACLSCHFMSFPTITAFGRSFKMNGFSDVGDQALIEDDDLSIPAVLNATVVIRPNFSATNVGGAGAVAAGTVANTATANITNDQVVLFGGRIGAGTGAFIELAGGTFGNIQVIGSTDLGGFKVGYALWKAGFGETSGLQITNAVGQHAGMLGGRSINAFEAINASNSGLSGAAGGVALWGGNDLLVAQVAGITASEAISGGAGNGHKLAPMVRIVAIPTVGDWDLALGATLISGKTGNSQTITALDATQAAPAFGVAPAAGAYMAAIGAPAATNALEMKKWSVDFGIEGAIGDTAVALYADYANAAASKGTTLNLLSGVLGKVSGYHVRTNIKPLHNVILTAGMGTVTNDGAAFLTPAAAVKGKTKQWQIGAEYEVFQNFVLALTYNVTSANPAAATSVVTKTKTTLLDVEWLM